MKTFYLTVLVLFTTLTIVAQRADKIAVHTEVGVKYDVFDKNSDFSGAQLFVSGLYPLDDNFFAGLGVGVHTFTVGNKNYSFPIYANVLYKIPISAKVIPFIDAKVGYGIVSKSYDTSLVIDIDPYKEEDYKVKNSGGLYFSPSVGILFPVKNKAISLSLSYDFQKIKSKWNNLSVGEVTEHSNTHSKTMALKIGFLF